MVWSAKALLSAVAYSPLSTDSKTLSLSKAVEAIFMQYCCFLLYFPFLLARIVMFSVLQNNKKSYKYCLVELIFLSADDL